MWRLKFWFEYSRERVAKWLAWCLPRRVLSWAYLRLAQEAYAGKGGQPVTRDMTVMEAHQQWSRV